MKKIFDCVVYTDEIAGFERCSIINLTTYPGGENRATVITKSKTQLRRIIKNVETMDEIKKDGCVYYLGE
ncbi:MAG: hypothetical protein ACRC68_05365 [Clostridium sp.]